MIANEILRAARRFGPTDRELCPAPERVRALTSLTIRAQTLVGFGKALLR